MKKIIINLIKNKRKFNSRIKRGIQARFMVLLFIAIALGTMGLAKANQNYETSAVLSIGHNGLMPISLQNEKTEIKPGLAKADIDKLNNEKDPEAIKAYIQEKAQEYNMDWKLVYAIGAYESGYFKSNLAQSQNNFFGRKATSTTWMKFDTPQEGIDNQFEYLKTRYIDKGMDTPAEMNHVYCEGNTWQFKVQYIMDNA